MKKLLFICLTLIFAISCTAKETTESALYKKLGFDSVLFDELKTTYNFTYSELHGYDKDENDIIIPGLSMQYDSKKTGEFLVKEQDKFIAKGYLIFISVLGFSTENGLDILGVIKLGSQFDVLKYKQTKSVNYDITNQNVIDKLTLWDQKYGIILLGADINWTSFIFKKLPTDETELLALASEIGNFCPDMVITYFQSVEEMANYIKKNRNMMLMWN